MTTKTFKSSSQDADIAKYDRQPCEIIRPLTADEADEEVGPMFNVRFADGHELHVFADELSDAA